MSLSINQSSASVPDKSGYLPQRYILGRSKSVNLKQAKYSVRMWNSEYFQLRKKFFYVLMLNQFKCRYFDVNKKTNKTSTVKKMFYNSIVIRPLNLNPSIIKLRKKIFFTVSYTEICLLQFSQKMALWRSFIYYAMSYIINLPKRNKFIVRCKLWRTSSIIYIL